MVYIYAESGCENGSIGFPRTWDLASAVLPTTLEPEFRAKL